MIAPTPETLELNSRILAVYARIASTEGKRGAVGKTAQELGLRNERVSKALHYDSTLRSARETSKRIKKCNGVPLYAMRWDKILTIFYAD